jgi:hypothetical protein
LKPRIASSYFSTLALVRTTTRRRGSRARQNRRGKDKGKRD